jgi:hypothetical protein
LNDLINLEQFKGRTIDYIKSYTDMYNQDYQEIIIYFTDGTTLEINAGGGYHSTLNIN